jgi:hypothetical protein
MKNIKLLLTTALFSTLIGCVNGDDYNTPDLSGECLETGVTETVLNLANNATTDPVKYEDDNVIEAYVTSSDEGGNFFKTLTLVSVDGNNGFSIPIDSYNLYNKFEPGRKVYVYLKDQYIEYDTQISSLEIGSFYDGGTIGDTPELTADDQVGRISGVTYENIIKRSCTKINEDDIVNNFDIVQTKNNANINKLIEIDNVQFSDASLNQNYYDEDVFTIGGATNHEIVDADGNTLTVRVSSYSTFAGEPIPSGSGKIRGVLTKFGSGFQFMIRTLADVQFDQPRIDSNPPLVGGSASYVSTLNEPFTSYSTNTQDFPAYINDAAVGSRYWQVRAFGGNQYIQMTSFGSPAEANRSLFIVPVDMTAANTLSFKTKAGFNNGAPLKVYYSTDYVFGSDVTTATLVDITANFTIDAGPSSGYSASFVNSGVYNIPAGITGNGVFLFEYVGNGSGGVTTTMQIDDIVIN